MVLSRNVSLFFVISVLVTYNFVVGEDVVYNIEEGDAIGRYIGNVATDSDLISVVGPSDFPNLRYSFLTTGSPHVSSFNIDERSSVLYTEKALDRETICEFKLICVVNLDVAAQSTIGSFFKKIRVTVYIDDINDNAPVFDKPSIELSISEAVLVGTSITIDGARDKDTSQSYSLQSYNVTPYDSPFSIKFLKNLDGTSIVQLLIQEALNRENKDFYQITVIAKDGGTPPRFGMLKVNITITDVNDNSPIFSSLQYNVTVKEDINVSTVIMTLSATDKDQGKNGKVFYRLSPHQSENNLELFNIHNETGDLYLKKRLQYIEGERYRIIVEASDMGDQPLTSQTIVHVYVKDVGNSPPVITVNLLSGTDVAKISEYADKGAVVAHIAIEDPDSGRNGDVICNIEASVFGLQRLDVKEFKIVVNGSLDRETRASHRVKLHCRDEGIPPLRTSSAFLVEVQDENDSPPVFTSNVYEESIKENNVGGEVVIQVRATDADVGKNKEILYFMASKDQKALDIDPNTGLVKTKLVFDREIADSHSFTVLAVDKGVPQLTGTATVSINVLDANDQAPVFSEPLYMFEIFENRLAGTLVNQLSATDNDLGNNAKVTFALEPNHSQLIPFILFPDGILKNDRMLDREVQSLYQFRVIATDLGTPELNSTAMVTVHVKDENDNVPVITAPSTTNNTIKLSVFTSTKTLVTTIRAFDLDDGVNAEIRYYIAHRNDSNIFELNGKTGALVLRKKITHKIGEMLTLELTASDLGTPKRSSKRVLNIIISETTGEPVKSNFLLVIIFVVVTIVFSTVIIITICILRRSDRMKKRKDKEMYEKANFHSGVAVYSLAGEESMGDKKKKKEVSFSLDDDDMCQIDQNTHQMALANNNLSIGNPFESKSLKKQDDNHSIISADASDSGRGGSDDETHSTRSPHPSGLAQSSSSHRPWTGYDRGHNTELQTFNSFRPTGSTSTPPVTHIGLTGVPPSIRAPPSNKKSSSNSVPNVHIHVTAEKCQRQKNNASFDSGNFSPATTIELNSDIRDCVV